MGGEEEWPEPSVAGVRLVDAPILFFVVTHKAFRAELDAVRRVAAEAAEGGEVIVELSRRLEFLKLVYDYHSVAEDEVIFLALDSQVKNVVRTYSLEHSSIDDGFSCIFNYLDLLISKEDDASQMFQDLISSIGTVQTMICHHMHKEEEQVFPLLIEKCSVEEQSHLVWQYMCTVPTILLEEFLPWTTRYLSSDEKLDVQHCIKLIVPNERLLQEVIISWIQHESSLLGANSIYGKRHQLLTGLSNRDIHKLYPLQISSDQEQQFKKACLIHKSYVEEPVKGIHIWHAALRRDLNQILDELFHLMSSNCSSSVSSVFVQLKFIVDVLIFYSNSLDKIFCNFSTLEAENSKSPCNPLIDECQIKVLRRLLLYESQGSTQLENSVEMLYQELKSLVRGLGKNLMLLETEVFPSITTSCTIEMQMWLLQACLYMMPLGLLRCTVTWFSSHLTENQTKSIIKKVEIGCPAISKTFTSLLCEWVHIGYSGKFSAEKFRKNLEEMFNGRSFYLTEQNRQKTIFSDWMFNPNTTTKIKMCADFPSSPVSEETGEHDIFNPSEMNIRIFFSQKFKRMPPLHRNLVEADHATSSTLKSRPMDAVFYFHRGLIKDLEYLVSLSAKLAADAGFLTEFKKRFKLLRTIYQIHSDSEDDIAFPALESKGALRNISHSYSIDHKLEFKYFTKTSIILEEISELHDQLGSNETRARLDKLFLEVHHTCLSMCKVLCDHMYREEVEIFPLFSESFSIDEEEKIIGHMLGRTRAEMLKTVITWLMAHLTSVEQHAMMSIWLKVARNTKFDEWLREWWEGMAEHTVSAVEEGSGPPDDPLEVVSMYLLKDGAQMKIGHNRETSGGKDEFQSQDISLYQEETDKKKLNGADTICHDVAEVTSTACNKLSHKEHPLSMNQEELDAALRRVSQDPNLDSREKTYLMQNLQVSQWTIMQKMHSQASVGNHEGDIPGQSPSYRDPLGVIFGCKHYKRNCKLLTPCCDKLYTCIRCHDDQTNHSVDRKAITKMMCMKCMVIQPIGQKCMSQFCNGFSMGRYYCRICKLFDDGRQIYHCPYCNLCRVGRGLGVDYFHCMKCNACMGKGLVVHICREKCLEDNCPICHEYIFTSNSPVKALQCGHLMHSSCFQVYTCSHYTCPICSKSLGDMQVYFRMLDALLSEQKIPEGNSGQTQLILCNDCEQRGTTSFHWLHHNKCSYCGSYNTRII
ncbi:zinc finger protein BRUTUS-like At1g74770 isoform X1 [Salvia hispanica]|uniref:zinc finger protein BRUTUS-like At1g74770 isoform X1 n=2 Tax=Salvia hispanica TaxID=49212 RepID=UPI00200915C6|nr:zinc finger protein BRUTUS-like At1g74770 isoform X1 [Salvia hispanica]XP_047955560.1 zinc finger protein BRUTUS-like At1g74770 isoform X1 [Salvia hispanica]